MRARADDAAAAGGSASPHGPASSLPQGPGTSPPRTRGNQMQPKDVLSGTQPQPWVPASVALRVNTWEAAGRVSGARRWSPRRARATETQASAPAGILSEKN